MAISMRRRGMVRFARRNAERRLAVLGPIESYFVSRCKVCRFKNGLYFFFSSRFGVRGLFLSVFVEGLLFLGEQTQREVAIVCARSGIGLMHSESRSFAAFSTRAKSVLGNAGHGIDHGIAKLKKLFFLFARKRVESPLAIIVDH